MDVWVVTDDQSIVVSHDCTSAPVKLAVCYNTPPNIVEIRHYKRDCGMIVKTCPLTESEQSHND